MNIQTERLEDQTARLTVEIDTDRLERAKRNAARNISKRVNIPGFRKGKAPYHILVQHGLENQILMDAIDELGQEVYREALEESDLEPYGPGSFEDYQLEPTVSFTYTVPLQPEVELNDYRSVRVDYEAPEVDDEMVDEAMKRLQQQEALVEESSEPAILGDRVTIDIHSEFADEPPESTADESEADAESDVAADNEDEEVDEAPPKGAAFIHHHDAAITLDPDDEPMLAGFNDELVGSSPGDELEFELTVPDDDPDYADIAGRKIKFNVGVKNVEKVTLPPLNDELAARVTEDEDEQLTLLQLRMRVRENIEKELERQTKEAYASQVLDEMVDIADIVYPEAMVQDQIDALLQDLDQRLRQQGLSLESYMKVTNTTREELEEQYREQAEDILKRSLVLGKVSDAENVEVSEEGIEARIAETLEQFGEQAESVRSIFDTPRMRSAMKNDMLQEQVLDRIAAIGKGEGDSIPSSEPSGADADVAADADVNVVAESTDLEISQTSEEAEESV